jgi:hypothetical protein
MAVLSRCEEVVKCYPNAYRSETATPAAKRLASAASVQSGRADRIARPTIAFSRFAMLASILLRAKSS